MGVSDARSTMKAYDQSLLDFISMMQVIDNASLDSQNYSDESRTGKGKGKGKGSPKGCFMCTCRRFLDDSDYSDDDRKGKGKDTDYSDDSDYSDYSDASDYSDDDRKGKVRSKVKTKGEGKGEPDAVCRGCESRIAALSLASTALSQIP